jgi:hypothetical protein
LVVELELAPLAGCFSSVLLEGALLEELELDGAALDGVLLDGAAELDEDEDGVLLEPAPAEPLGAVAEPLTLLEPEPEGAALEGAALDEDDDPPLAWSFLLMSIEVDEELEPEGAVLGAAVVPPADDEDDEPGAAVEPEGAVVEDELEARSGARSHAAINDAPSARETATAMVESLMWPPWLGYRGSSKDRAGIVKSQPTLRQWYVSSS